jgi:replicative DNA helicase
LNPPSLKDKIPPYNEEAEEAAIGALLLNFSGDILDQVQSVVQADDFYKPAHGNILRAINQLNDRGAVPDILSVKEELKTMGLLEKSGGSGYLAHLTSSVPTTANVDYYAKIVKDCAVRRNLLNVANQMIANVHSDSIDSRNSIESAEKDIFKISDSQNHGNLKAARDIVRNAVEMVEERYRQKGEFTGVPSGFQELDTLTSGFQNSEMIIIGARPSIGKTAFALSMAANVSITKKIPCGFFTLEMSALSLMSRLLAQDARINSNSLRTGLLSKTDFRKLADSAGRIYEAPLVIEDTPNISLLDMRSMARKMKAKYDVKIIFIDYIGLVTPEDKSTPRHEQMAEVSRSLKALARELDIPIVVLSQVGRQTEGKAPGLADLRESGAIEQDADVVMLLHRERIVDKSGDGDENGIRTQVIVAKQRNGPTDTVEVMFIPRYTRFESLTHQSP